MTIENLQQNLIQDFEFFEDWTQKYEYMIELSKGLDKMDQEMKKLVFYCSYPIFAGS